MIFNAFHFMSYKYEIDKGTVKIQQPEKNCSEVLYYNILDDK